MTGDGIECQHMTTCADRPCFQGSQCFDDESQGYRCGPCPVGYKGNGVTCALAIRCSDNPCYSGVSCVNYDKPPGYRCGACPQGMTGNGITCEDVDECEYRPCNPQSQCVNLSPGFRCGPCPQGYTGRQFQGIGLEFARANRQVWVGKRFSFNQKLSSLLSFVWISMNAMTEGMGAVLRTPSALTLRALLLVVNVLKDLLAIRLLGVIPIRARVPTEPFVMETLNVL